MAAPAPPNPLLTSSTADSSPAVQLHPLVILNISDYITRHKLRGQKGPLVGAILGLQNGREITMEVPFDCKYVEREDGSILLDEVFFKERLEQYQTVFKSPQLELVGWFTTGQPSGPEQRHLPIQLQLQTDLGYESAMLLLFHIALASQTAEAGGKLPLTLYETIWTNEGSMDIEGPERNQPLRFREVPHTVEASDAEMIAVDFVARGGGNATAVESETTSAETKSNENGKGKGKAKVEGTEEKDELYLNHEEEEHIAGLQAKANAVRMLQTRIDLLLSYLSSQPPSYLDDATTPMSAEPPPNHEILRSINALVARLPHLSAANSIVLEREIKEAKTDAQLLELIATLTDVLPDIRELGQHWAQAQARTAPVPTLGTLRVDKREFGEGEAIEAGGPLR
ncbi:hypothetical protein EJ06DRAFT_581857 [Trichodelitschia bisporula]|uniref:COP9 signalosome complex subunit 6 n=1 Tax=Trichodelitschia bisporula TaxID=703511 RepID=A0A6G1HYI9_9PEZI|nr:hypothetical protein EJ06DRAFT_581857 [Trichodelitschia bisporula]